MGRRNARTLGTCSLALGMALASTATGEPPDGNFTGELVTFCCSPGNNNANKRIIGLEFTPAGQGIAWEKTGKVFALPVPIASQSVPFLDIGEEVGDWGAQGLTALAIHPDFLTTPYIYLAYTVDRHHLDFFGTPDYDPMANNFPAASIIRVTRYTCTLDENDHISGVVPGSRQIILGTDKADGIAAVDVSHGVGTIAFGEDGSLIIGTGESGSGSGTGEFGQGTEPWEAEAVTAGILRPEEDIGSYRSQLVDTHLGKLLRIDPDTGEGMPDNPFYDAMNPRAPRSRVWALGARQPWRWTIRPGTGSAARGAAHPGDIFFGDVGWGTWEELDVCDAPAQNFGWPIWEGFDTNTRAMNNPRFNLDAPNPLFDGSSCTVEHFSFHDLIAEDTLDPGSVNFPNPCDPGEEISPALTWFHERPKLAWGRLAGENGPIATGIYSGNDAAVITIDDPGSPVGGSSFPARSVIGGIFIPDDSAYPDYYDGMMLFADHINAWICLVEFNPSNDPVRVIETDWKQGSGLNQVADIAYNPLDNKMYVVRWPQWIYRLDWVPTPNGPPVAVAESDVTYGPTDLTVNFTGSNSSDPEEGPLTYEWDFGDGSPVSTAADPTHVFTASPGVPTSYTVTLTVTDDELDTDTDTILISVENSPPMATILNPADGSEYHTSVPPATTQYELIADVTDNEHTLVELDYRWETVLIHDGHEIIQQVLTEQTGITSLMPLGCEEPETFYHYEIRLTVTDPEGLEAYVVHTLNADCDGSMPRALADLLNVPGPMGSSNADVLSNDVPGAPLDPATVEVVVAPAAGITTVIPSTGEITYTHTGAPVSTDIFGYTVRDTLGVLSNIAYVSVSIEACPGDVTTTGAGMGQPGFGDPDDVVDLSDLLYYVNVWNADLGTPTANPGSIADVTTTGTSVGQPGFGVPDGNVDLSDLLLYVNQWNEGLSICPG